MTNIYKRAIAAGIPTENHCSDLYLPVTEETRRLVREYDHKKNVTAFRSQCDGRIWYDIPFAYSPFWEAKQKGHHV